MEKKFKRALTGYDMDSIQQEIEKLDVEHKLRLSELRQEIAVQALKREALKTELDKIQHIVQERKKVEDTIKDRLFAKYLEFFYRHKSESQSMEESIIELQVQLKSKQAELEKYQGYLDKIKSDILNVRDNFEDILKEGAETIGS